MSVSQHVLHEFCKLLYNCEYCERYDGKQIQLQLLTLNFLFILWATSTKINNLADMIINVKK